MEDSPRMRKVSEGGECKGAEPPRFSPSVLTDHSTFLHFCAFRILVLSLFEC